MSNEIRLLIKSLTAPGLLALVEGPSSICRVIKRRVAYAPFKINIFQNVSILLLVVNPARFAKFFLLQTQIWLSWYNSAAIGFLRQTMRRL